MRDFILVLSGVALGGFVEYLANAWRNKKPRQLTGEEIRAAFKDPKVAADINAKVLECNALAQYLKKKA